MRQQKLKTRDCDCEATVQLLPSRVKSAPPPLLPRTAATTSLPTSYLVWQFVLVDNLFEYFA